MLNTSLPLVPQTLHLPSFSPIHFHLFLPSAWLTLFSTSVFPQISSSVCLFHSLPSYLQRPYKQLFIFILFVIPLSCFSPEYEGLESQSNILCWRVITLPWIQNRKFTNALYHSRGLVILDSESSFHYHPEYIIHFDFKVHFAGITLFLSLLFFLDVWIKPFQSKKPFFFSSKSHESGLVPTHKRWKSTLLRHCWIMDRPWQWQHLWGCLNRLCWIDLYLSW